jgi:hypothetical protein
MKDTNIGASSGGVTFTEAYKSRGAHYANGRMKKF